MSIDEISLDEFNRRVEAQLQKEMAQRREAIAAQMRQEASDARYRKINARHPVEDKYGGLGPEGHAERLRIMDERHARYMENLKRINSRPIAPVRGPRGSLPQTGSEGFEIKAGGDGFGGGVRADGTSFDAPPAFSRGGVASRAPGKDEEPQEVL